MGLIPEELRLLYLLPACQPGLLSLGFPGFGFPWTNDTDLQGRMSVLCFDLIIMKVVTVTPSSTDPLGVRRESRLELFRRKV